MKKTVLIVDDDTDIVDVVRRVAESLHVNTITESFQISLPDIEKLSPDLIVLDHWLPVISGGDLCRQLKSHEPTKHIPIILLSAVVNLPVLAEFCQADGYVAKPFDVRELGDAIRSFLQ